LSEVVIGTGWVIKVLGTTVPTLAAKPAGAFSFAARLMMFCHVAVSCFLVNDTRLSSVDVEAGAFCFVAPLLAVTTVIEKPDTIATATMVKRVLDFMGDSPHVSFTLVRAMPEKSECSIPDSR